MVNTGNVTWSRELARSIQRTVCRPIQQSVDAFEKLSGGHFGTTTGSARDKTHQRTVHPCEHPTRQRPSHAAQLMQHGEVIGGSLCAEWQHHVAVNLDIQRQVTDDGYQCRCAVTGNELLRWLLGTRRLQPHHRISILVEFIWRLSTYTAMSFVHARYTCWHWRQAIARRGQKCSTWVLPTYWD